MESVFEARARAIDCYAEIKDVIDAAKTQEDLRIMEKKLKAMKAEFEALNSKSAAIEQKAIAKQNAEYKKQTAIAEQKDGSCQVDIIGVTKVEDINKKPIHLYKVSSYFGTKSGLTQVRYSQFKTLRENMIKWLNIKGRQNLIENVPPLPPAKLKLFKEHDSAFIQERRSGLQTFLKNVMRLPKIIECEALRRFLEI